MEARNSVNSAQIEETAETVTNANTLRAMAHPIRMRILAELRVEGKQTVGSIGKKLGESSGVISYHLGQLEQAGLVRRVESSDGDRRKSWWQACQSAILLKTANQYETEAEMSAAQQATDLFRRSAALSYEMAFERFLDNASGFSEAWNEACTSDDHILRLTAHETQELVQELNDVIQRWQRSTAKRPIYTIDSGNAESVDSAESDEQLVSVILQIFRWVP